MHAASTSTTRTSERTTRITCSQTISPAWSFWEHPVKVYREAYPGADSNTASILQVGSVAKERHRDAPREEDRSEHNHCATFSSLAQYWRRVRKISADKYSATLVAVAHDVYSSMCKYLRAPTKEKPLPELDTRPFYSPHHPEGDALKKLLDDLSLTYHNSVSMHAFMCVCTACVISCMPLAKCVFATYDDCRKPFDIHGVL